MLPSIDTDHYVFQSTLPVGGRHPFFPLFPSFISISIHAPRGGSDTRFFHYFLVSFQFQSTLPVGGATQESNQPILLFFKISIHAPRGGSDT